MPEDETMIMEENLEVAEAEDFYAEEEGIFEGGPSKEMVEVWKKKYGDIFLTEIENDGIFIWRVLNRKEIREMAQIESSDSLFKEDIICNKCIIWPVDFKFDDDSLAGTATTLSEQIFEKSGFRALTSPIPL